MCYTIYLSMYFDLLGMTSREKFLLRWVFGVKSKSNRGCSVIHKEKLPNSYPLNFCDRNTLEDKQWTFILSLNTEVTSHESLYPRRYLVTAAALRHTVKEKSCRSPTEQCGLTFWHRSFTFKF
jgi:hypothetical protein